MTSGWLSAAVFAALLSAIYFAADDALCGGLWAATGSLNLLTAGCEAGARTKRQRRSEWGPLRGGARRGRATLGAAR